MIKRYSEEHQWVVIKDGTAIVGITGYAASELGKITFVELPDVGIVVSQADPLCVVESSKAASDVFAPVGGTVTEVNLRLEKEPELINSDPEVRGWICKLNDLAELDIENLMTESQYDSYIGEDEEN